MSKVIYKYQLFPRESQRVNMPEGAIILDAQYQGEDLFLWAIVDVQQPNYQRHINIFGTGHTFNIKAPQVHIATVQNHGFVWHIFEAIIDKPAQERG